MAGSVTRSAISADIENVKTGKEIGLGVHVMGMWKAMRETRRDKGQGQQEHQPRRPDISENLPAHA